MPSEMVILETHESAERLLTGLSLQSVIPTGCDWSHPKMTSPKNKAKKRPPKDSMTLLPCFYFVELPIVLSSLVSLYFLELTDVLSPAMVGFRCHDRDLSMPYVETGDELIPLLMLLSLAFAGPAASIMMGEGLMYCMQSKLKTCPKSESSINAGGCSFNSFLRRTVRFVGVHVFGLLATALVTDVIQLATGYHAPFFLTVCQPNYTAPGVSCDNNAYVTQDICMGKDQYAIMSARKTFPSQHATLSGFAAVYISMYFNASINSTTKLLKPLLVFAFCMAAGLSGLTQITQHRSHPIDVYVGYLIGAGIGVYLAVYAVGNFKASDEDSPSLQKLAPALQKDSLRVLSQRSHDSLYRKTPRVSESREELGAGLGSGARSKVRREKASLASLKRASADVELLATRGPMGKETMVTFSNTLPRVANGNSPISPSDEPVTTQRHMTFHVPFDPQKSRQLVSEWKQRSLELRSQSSRDEEEDDEQDGGDEGGATAGDGGDMGMPSSLYPTVQANKGIATPTGVRMVVAPPLVHIPEEASRPPPVSPKSAKTRAKWLSLTEGGSVKEPGPGPIAVSTPRVPSMQPNQPPSQHRITQVIAMSKPQSHGHITSSAKTSEGGSSSGGGSNCSESPYYRIPSDRDSCTGSNPGSIAGSGSIVTIDAHAPHHPVVRVSAANGKPWEWRNTISGNMLVADTVGDKHRIALQRQDNINHYRDYRTLPMKTDSLCSSSASGSAEGGPELPPPPLPTSTSPLPPPPQLCSSPLPPPPPHSSSSPLPPPPHPSSSPLPPPLPHPASSHMPPPPHPSSQMSPPPLPSSYHMPPPPHPSSSPMPPPPHPSICQMPPPPQPSASMPPPPHPSCSSMLPPPPHPDLLMEAHSQTLSRSSTLPRRPSARSHAEQEHYYKAMQNERML
ncbi:phospholipid phosphatase-related protein type 3a isoform X1 [Hippoglossus stenolepis]|uniref:phospholipid phosphatase-related protein type 3a isoform X1 n=2 Tax=Hippoglossus stenolepis TaxID=195615 RepID=UPI001FAFC9EE|nr:phospholipid phosphatase-related protein type 3a isoform X1 [Hippoglossus stenolepis]